MKEDLLRRREAEVTVIVPLKNEAGNIFPLLEEIEHALVEFSFEILFINDGSEDETGLEIDRAARERPWVRAIHHEKRSFGQSAAIRTGIFAAQAPLIVTIDGDGQNDPAFIPVLIEEARRYGQICGLVQGCRVDRQGNFFKKSQSRVANWIRRKILKDSSTDSGCGLKCFRKEMYQRLPYFDALHRFMPALVHREGLRIYYVDILDRPRQHGSSKYGFFNRLGVGIIDLFGVCWLMHRHKRPNP